MKNAVIPILLGLLFAVDAMPQVVNSKSSPLGLSFMPEGIEWFNPGFSDSEISSLLARQGNNNGMLEFALTREVDLSPLNSGAIVDSDKGFSVWYLPIYSDGASSLNIIFSTYFLTEGEKVFVYNPSSEDVLGPFTSFNNKESGSLPVMPVSGNVLIVEYHRSRLNPGTLEVGQVAHDVLGVFGSDSSKDQYFNSSGPCNVDINCPEGSDWQTEKRSVFRILAAGAYLGTGFLVNNSNQENIPYAITANHVIRDAGYAANSLAVFAYESPWCDGPDGRVSFSVAGAELVASNEDIDLVLVKLSVFPPITYKPYLAGWDVSGITPVRSASIHHPSGDVKKISLDNNAPAIGTFQELENNGFWKILQWDLGTTEGGSSGSPLFDQNRRVVGYLSGGEAICGNSVNDYFARLDVAYDLSQDMFMSLKPWLDPAVSGIQFLDGRDPYADNLLGSDTLFNGDPADKILTPYPPSGMGYTTGLNSDSIVAYAERFYTPQTVDITEIWLWVGKRAYTLPSDSVTVAVHTNNNGPGSIIRQKGILVKESLDSLLLKVSFREPVTVSGDFYISYRLWYKLPSGFDQSQFALYHGQAQAPGSDFAWFKNSSGWHPFSDHPFDPHEATLWIGVIPVSNSVINSLSNPQFSPGPLKVYPNPFGSGFNLLIEDYLPPGSLVTVTDIYGRTVFSSTELTEGVSRIELDSSIPAGIYFVAVERGNERAVTRVIKTTGQ